MIGIFDSGLGGLSVAHAIRAQFKTADLLYYGDTRNAPYGEKSADELARFERAAQCVFADVDQPGRRRAVERDLRHGYSGTDSLLERGGRSGSACCRVNDQLLAV